MARSSGSPFVPAAWEATSPPLLKSLVGGEIRSYVKLNEDARRQAIDRMVQNAAAMGANAVTMMRFDSTEMGRSMSEIVAYGTARVVEWPSDAKRPEG